MFLFAWGLGAFCQSDILGVWRLSSLGQLYEHYMPMWLMYYKNLGHEVSGELAWLAALHMWSHFVSGKIKPVCMWLYWDGTCVSLCLVLLNFTHVSFPFADFNVYPFTAISCNNEYNNNFMSLLSTSSKSWGLKVVLGRLKMPRVNYSICYTFYRPHIIL